MAKYDVEVTQNVCVTVDETKFTEEFMEEFRESFFHYYTIEDHVEHLASLFARGVVEPGEFIEGYGEPEEMGIDVEFTGEFVVVFN